MIVCAEILNLEKLGKLHRVKFTSTPENFKLDTRLLMENLISQGFTKIETTEIKYRTNRRANFLGSGDKISYSLVTKHTFLIEDLSK